jgi:hypothetical protein
LGRTLGRRHGAGGGAGDVGVAGGGRRGVGGRGVVRGRRGRGRGDLLRRERRVGRVPRGWRGRRGVASSGGGGGRRGRRMHVAGGEVWPALRVGGGGYRLAPVARFVDLGAAWSAGSGFLFSLFRFFDSRILMRRRSGLQDLRETFDLREYSTVTSRTWQFSNFDLSSGSKFLSREGPCLAS